MTPVAIEPATFRCVAQHLNHCAFNYLYRFKMKIIFRVLHKNCLLRAKRGRAVIQLVEALRLKCDGTLAETRFRLSVKRTSPFNSAGGRQFSRLLAAEVCASAVVMLDTPCSEVV